MNGYKKVKGWNGRIYFVEMTEQEVRERNEFHLMIVAPVAVIIMTVLFMAVSGYKFF